MILDILVGPAGVEPTTNGLKVLMLSKLLNVLLRFFSVTKKWCVRSVIVRFAVILRNFAKGILAIPVMRLTFIL